MPHDGAGPYSRLNLVEIREIRLSVIRGRLPNARDVVKLCEQLEDGGRVGSSDDSAPEDSGDFDDEGYEEVKLERDKLKTENERLVKML